MIETDPNFRDMCEELAEAERAFSRVHRLPSSIREARSAEWTDLVGRLAREVEAALEATRRAPKSADHSKLPR